MLKSAFLFFIIFLSVPLFAEAQHENMDHKKMQSDKSNPTMSDSMNMPNSSDMNSKEMEMKALYGSYSMTREASGTSWQPDSTPHSGIHFMQDDWMFMMHGFANFVYDKQSGPRGDDKTFSQSMFMFMGQHPLGNGTFGFRSMVSLDPLMGKDGYPLLLQTGETPDGISPLIDRQHPHDLFMELATSYSMPVSDESSVFVYAGLPGEPALGPPAFMHRLSGMDNPVAPLSHHWLDSTHITYGVTTLGYIWKDFKLEGSAFRGREPDESRWDIEAPKLDSYSSRLSYNLGKNWSFQGSYGRIDSPEQLHPEVDTQRYSASAAYNQPFEKGNWQTMFAWGRDNNNPGHNLDAFLIESEVQLLKIHTIFTRFERIEKDELFDDSDSRAGDVFKVNQGTLGYIYDLPEWHKMRWGIGAEYTWYFLPSALDSVYGKTPTGYMIFARVKL